MKVFKYDTTTASRGEFITDVKVCAQGGYVRDVKFPRHNPDTHSWEAMTFCADIKNNRITFNEPVCFCSGQFTAGEDAPIWQWNVLIPEA